MIVESKGGLKFDLCDDCEHLLRRVASKCDCCTAKETPHKDHHASE